MEPEIKLHENDDVPELSSFKLPVCYLEKKYKLPPSLQSDLELVRITQNS